MNETKPETIKSRIQDAALFLVAIIIVAAIAAAMAHGLYMMLYRMPVDSATHVTGGGTFSYTEQGIHMLDRPDVTVLAETAAGGTAEFSGGAYELKAVGDRGTVTLNGAGDAGTMTVSGSNAVAMTSDYEIRNEPFGSTDVRVEAVLPGGEILDGTASYASTPVSETRKDVVYFILDGILYAVPASRCTVYEK